MSELETHVISGAWDRFFDETEIDHVLTFLYNVIKWIIRDKADLLEINSHEFIWSKNGQVMSIFPITISNPTPSFIEKFSQILNKDAIVKKYFKIIQNGPSVFIFEIKLIS